MKKLFFTVLLLLGNITNVSAADLLNISSYNEGDTSLGENVIVGMVEKTGEKYLTGHNGSGKLKFPVNLSGSFDIEFKVLEDYCCTEWFDFFLTADEHKMNVTFYGGGSVKLTADSESGGSDASQAFMQDEPNAYRLSVNNNIAKLYVNDIFSQKVTLTPNLVYTQIVINGVDVKDALYAVEVNGNSGSTSTPTGNGNNSSITCPTQPVATPSGDCMASYSANGQLHVPCVSVPDVFGKVTVYDIKMQQRSEGFTFDLDLNSVNAK